MGTHGQFATETEYCDLPVNAVEPQWDLSIVECSYVSLSQGIGLFPMGPVEIVLHIIMVGP